MYGRFNVERVNALDNQMRNDAIAVNSLICSSGDLIKISGAWFSTLATTGDRIDGVAIDNFTFASDNQTVSQLRVNFIPAQINQGTWKAPMTGGVLTEANIGDFFSISATQFVDFATASPTTGVVKCVKVFPWGLSGEFLFTGQGT